MTRRSVTTRWSVRSPSWNPAAKSLRGHVRVRSTMQLPATTKGREATMELVTKKRLQLFSGRSHTPLAEEIAANLDVTLGEANLSQFANGELHCRFGESIRGSDVFILQTHSRPVNEAVMEQLIMIDAAKRASAKRITAVCPFYGYARQDRKASGREPITAKLVADMIDTASTLCAAAEILTERGATCVWAMATHGVLSDPATDRLKNSPIERVVITNTLPLPPEKQIDKIEVLSVAKIIADAVDAVFEDTSVSEIFGGENQS